MNPVTDGEVPTASAPALSVIVPVHNERPTLAPLVDKLRRVDFGVPIELLFVDDGSTDGSGAILDTLLPDPLIRVLHHAVNGGKGAAVQTGLQHASGSYVVVQDADLELEPGELRTLLEAAIASPGSVCFGSRFMGNNRRYHKKPTYWANRLLTTICNLLTGLRLSDMNTCYKLMPVGTARQIRLTSRGFSMEPEITIKLARLGVPIIERPVSYHPRDAKAGKKIRAIDFFRYLRAMVVYRWSRLDCR